MDKGTNEVSRPCGVESRKTLGKIKSLLLSQDLCKRGKIHQDKELPGSQSSLGKPKPVGYDTPLCPVSPGSRHLMGTQKRGDIRFPNRVPAKGMV